MKQLLFFALLGVFTRVATAQELQECGPNPFLGTPTLRISGVTMRTSGDLYRLTMDTIKLPYVIHIIDTGGTTICSDQWATETVFGMNQRFNGSLTGNGLNTGIQFSPAKRDPSGKATNGITHFDASSYAEYKTNGFQYGSNTTNQILNATRWDATKYINIWVFHKIVGYGGLTAPIDWGLAGGIFMNVSYFSQSGSTTTHEMGHFFGLAHVFEGSTTTVCVENSDPHNQGDQIWDTPPVLQGYCGNLVACDNSAPGINSFQNYLGIDCAGHPRDRFTPGQQERMLSFIATYGQSLINSDALNPPIVTAVATSANKITRLFPNPARNSVQLETHSQKQKEFSVQVINLLGDVVYSQEFTTSMVNNVISLNVQSLVPGNYFLQLQDDEGFSVERLTIQ